MKPALIVIVVLAVGGLVYWFLIMDSSRIGDTQTENNIPELVPPALPE
jgi:hypothetical protein